MAKNQHEEKVEFFDNKQVSFANKDNQLADNSPSDLINLAQPQPQLQPEQKPAADLLDITAQTQQTQPEVKKPANSSLLDLDSEQSTKPYQTSANNSVSYSETSYATSILGNQGSQGSSVFNFIEPKTFKNIVIPYVEVISEEEFSRERKYTGLSVKAAFQREADKVYLQLQFTNTAQIALNVYLPLLRTSRSR